MLNCWNVPGLDSGKKPSEFAAGEPPPCPFPPDPPDPSSPLSPVNFPPLSNQPLTVPKRLQRQGSQQPSAPVVSHNQSLEASSSSILVAEGLSVTPLNTTLPQTFETLAETLSRTVTPTVPVPASSTQITSPLSPISAIPFTTLSPKATSPLLTNGASSNSLPTIPLNPSLPSLLPIPIPPSSSSGAPSVTPNHSALSLVEKLRAAEDKTLKRLAPVTLSSSGRPRVLIPDAVFAKGAEIHKDFIICYYNGKAPPFNQIQSVFNHLWGKGKKLEIHNNPINRTTLVRIQSDYLRQKILEKCVWYVGDTMFHTALWSEVRSLTAPPIKAIRIWAHLTGVPLDLRHQAGLSLVAGLVGEPKETDDFTKNMVSLTISHIKVEVKLTQDLPSVVEFERESGEVVEVSVHYPWVPPTCSHCKELGHIIRNCFHYSPPVQDNGDGSTGPQKSAKKKPTKVYRPINSAATNQKTTSQFSEGLLGSQMPTPPLNPFPPPLNPLPPFPSTTIKPFTPFSHPPPKSSPSPIDIAFSFPDPVLRPSLKRSRSSPTLSPPPSSNPNPFIKPLPLPLPILPPLTTHPASPITSFVAPLPPVSSHPDPLLPLPTSPMASKDPPPPGDPSLPSQ